MAHIWQERVLHGLLTKNCLKSKSYKEIFNSNMLKHSYITTGFMLSFYLHKA